MKTRFLLALTRLLAKTPLPLCHALGVVAGMLLYWIPNRNRHDARVNIALCFPDMPEREVRRLVRRSLVETAKTFVEMPAIWLGDPKRWVERVDAEGAVEMIRQALARGRGLIIAAPHLGNWELGSFLLAEIAPFTAIYSPPRQREFEQLMVEGRSRNGTTMVPTNAVGVKRLFRALKSGEMVGILPDQEPKAGGRESGVFAPFFGTPASTMVLISRLAQKTGAPVLYAYVERTGGDPGYRLRTVAAPEEIHSGDLVASATALNRGVERCVLQCPEQYQWSYRRFRARPDGGRSRYA